MAVRNNAGNLTVTVQLEPQLEVEKGHMLQAVVGDSVMATSAAPTLNLTNIDRGSHILTVRVVDRTGQTLVTSAPHTFHMMRYSRLSPANRNRSP